MPSPFQRLDLAARLAHEATFGEAFTFRPKELMSDVNAPRAPSGRRAITPLMAIYSEKDAEMIVKHSWDRHTDTRPGAAMHTHIIDVDPRIWNIDVQKGDLFDRADPVQRWRIVSTDPQSDGVVLCNVERM